MRILLSCLQSDFRHPIPGYRFWRTYFVNGLVEAGHEVLEVPAVDWAEGVALGEPGALTAWRDRTWSNTIRFASSVQRAKNIDLFLSYLYPKQIEPGAIAELRRIGIPCVNFFCDNVREFRNIPKLYAPFDLHWVPEFEALPLYRRARLPHIHAAMPCWVPASHRETPVMEREPAAFIGSSDELRRDLLGRAIEAGADISIYGAGWSATSTREPSYRAQSQGPVGLLGNQIALARQHGWSAVLRKVEQRVRPLSPPPIPRVALGGALGDGDYVTITRESVVTVGINRVPSLKRSLQKPLVYSRLRDVEAPMLGACYLTEWTAGLEELFQLGSDIETYRSPEELVEKLAVLRREPQRRAKMRTLAQQRALGELTVGRTVARIAIALGTDRNSGISFDRKLR